MLIKKAETNMASLDKNRTDCNLVQTYYDTMTFSTACNKKIFTINLNIEAMERRAYFRMLNDEL